MPNNNSLPSTGIRHIIFRNAFAIIVLAGMLLNLTACQSYRSLSDRMESKYSSKKRKTYISRILPSGPTVCELPVRVSEDSFEGMLAFIGEYRGIKYRFGGDSPEGFDCSGFVQHLYSKSFQMLLPRTSNDIAMLGNMVPKKKLQPGDLVFFSSNGNRVDHVGVFIGNDSFAHSATSRGITVNSLQENYYQEHYAFASRIITVN
jgi:cell wall-associated NlpC family hydrolase